MIKFLPIFTAFFFGCSPPNPVYLQINYEAFTPSYSQPFTQELKHYKSALDWCNQMQGEKNTVQFPDPEHLASSAEYELFFSPPILQGAPVLALKMKFENEMGAQVLFEKYGSYAKLFDNKLEYKRSFYCNSTDFHFASKYKFPEDVVIKLFKAPWCSGQDDHKLGGIVSGIALDKNNRTIVCWVQEI